MLQSIFGNKNTPDALRAKLAQLESEEAALVAEYQEAALVAADDTAKQKEADKAHAAMRDHQLTTERTRAALVAALRAEAAQARELAASTTASAWNNCVDAARACEPLAAAYAASLAEAGQHLAELRKAVARVHQAVPPGVSSNNQDGFFPELDALTFAEYAIHKLPGAINPWGLELKSLATRFPGHTARIVRARDEALRDAPQTQEEAA